MHCRCAEMVTMIQHTKSRNIVEKMATILMLMSILTGCRNKNDEASRQRLHEAIIEKLTSVTREFTSVEEPGAKMSASTLKQLLANFLMRRVGLFRIRFW